MMSGLGGIGLMGVLMTLLWLGSAAAMFAAGYYAAGRHRLVARPDDSLALLRRRLASGEIDDEEYLRILSAMETR